MSGQSQQNKLIPNNNNTAINTQYNNIINKDNIDLLNSYIKPIIEKEINKIVSINEQISKLKNKAPIVNESKKLKEILPKYITFLEYIKKIIQVKIIKDITIVKLINDVFEKVNVVIEKTNLANYGIYTPNNNDLKKKEQELQNLKNSKKKKIYLVDIGDIEYKNDITQLENCTESIKSTLNEAIEGFNKELEPIKVGGTKNTFSLNDDTKPFYNALSSNNVFEKINSAKNTIDATELNNKKVELINKHTKSLNELKDKYEKGLQTNINDFKYICEALKNLINKIKDITNILSNKKTQVINLNKQKKEELEKQIDELKKQNDPVTIKGLKISDFEDANVFTENHIALENIKQQINTKSNELTQVQNVKEQSKNPTQDTVNAGQQDQILPQGQQDQTLPQGRQGNNTSSTISDTNSLNTVISELNNVKNSDDIPENINYNMEILQKLSDKLKSLYNTYTNPDDLKNEFQNISTTSNGNISEDDITIKSDNDIQRYNRIVNRINNKKNRIDQLAIYIYVMKKYINADDIKKKLYLEVRKKNLFIQNDPIKLEKILQQSAGKSKNSKSKTSKATSKKAKSTKKQKAPKTQTKSYNNPKYKNQDGGFVRGGVLFPESFYRSDIVM